MKNQRNAMGFERVINKFLYNLPPERDHHSAYTYNTNLKEASAMLFSVCMKERVIGEQKYSEIELEKLDFYISHLLSEPNSISLIEDCINLLESK